MVQKAPLSAVWLRPASCPLTRRRVYYSGFSLLSQSRTFAARPDRPSPPSCPERPPAKSKSEIPDPWERHMLGRIGVALAVGFLKLLALIPYGITARFGDGLGWLLYQVPSHRKRIVHINLGLCFPEWSAERVESVAQQHFRHAIRSYVERSVQWFGS